MKDLIDKVKKIIKENIYATIGTCGNVNLPWVSPLFISYDNQLNFYWLSPKNSWHSKNLRENNDCSLVMFDSRAPKWTGIGVYMLGTAVELFKKEEIEKGLKLEYERLEEGIPSYEGYIGDNEYRVYKFVPSKIWATDDTEDEKGISVDHRTKLRKESLSLF